MPRLSLQSIIPRGAPRWAFIVALLVLIPIWVIPFWLLRDVVPPGELLPLHYNVYLGVDYAGPWYVSLFFPGFATIVLILNTVIATRLRKESKLLANTLVVSAMFVSILTLLALFFVLVLNA